MTHNFKHIIVKREDNLNCLCYPELPPVMPDQKYCETFKSDACNVRFTCCLIEYRSNLKAWEESVVRIPVAKEHESIFIENIHEAFNDWFFSNPSEVKNIGYDTFEKNGVEFNPELVEIREDKHAILNPIFNLPTHYAFLSSPKEEKAEPKYPIGGYAPGHYMCTCCTCKNNFMGDKRAVQCEPCALETVDSVKPVEERGCEFGEHDPIPLLGLENAVIGDQCRVCGKKLFPVEEVKEEESEDFLWIEVAGFLGVSIKEHERNYLKTKFKITRK